MDNQKKKNEDMPKKKVVLTLYRKEIEYDIRNKARLTALRQTEISPEQRSYLEVDDLDRSSNQMSRSISNAYGALRAALSEYLEANTPTADDELVTAGNMTVTLRMPMGFRNSVVRSVAPLMHRYIVDYALAEWYALGGSVDASTYATAAGEELAAIESLLNARRRPLRECQKPVLVPGGCEFTDTLEVKVECPERGGEVYYTTDEAAGFHRLEGVIVLTQSMTIQAICSRDGLDDSEIVTETYIRKEVNNELL